MNVKYFFILLLLPLLLKCSDSNPKTEEGDTIIEEKPDSFFLYKEREKNFLEKPYMPTCGCYIKQEKHFISIKSRRYNVNTYIHCYLTYDKNDISIEYESNIKMRDYNKDNLEIAIKPVLEKELEKAKKYHKTFLTNCDLISISDETNH